MRKARRNFVKFYNEAELRTIELFNGKKPQAAIVNNSANNPVFINELRS